MLRPIDDLVADAVDLTGHAATQRGVVVSTSSDGRALQVGGDALRLERVIINLLSNAIKHSRRGGTVRTRLRGLDDGRAWAELVVSDDGAGMSPAEVAAAFRFAAGRAGDGSSGFGLTLGASRVVVEACGGRIWLTSTPGRGTDAFLRLPLAPVVPRDDEDAPGT